MSTPDLITGLRRWARTHDLTTRAAVELLIEHGTWLCRAEFRTACVIHSRADRDYWIDWRAARAAFDDGAFAYASSTEVAVLDLAIALGQDRYRFNRMGAATAALVTAAITAALGGTR